MRCGLYGKLPAKRDFIAVAAPREFLAAYEPWLQGGISASRMLLGAGWRQAYLRAPIWRFWLGAEICGGGAVLGALMPSVDGIGRYFPLTLFARAEPGESLPPPEIDGHEDWLAAAEDVLLSALAEGATYEGVAAAFEGLVPPAAAPAEVPPGTERGGDGTLATPWRPGGLSGAFSRLRLADHARADAGSSFWWTIGGEDFPPRLAVARRLPDPHLFVGLLTGRFAEGSA